VGWDQSLREGPHLWGGRGFQWAKVGKGRILLEDLPIDHLVRGLGHVDPPLKDCPGILQPEVVTEFGQLVVTQTVQSTEHFAPCTIRVDPSLAEELLLLELFHYPSSEVSLLSVSGGGTRELVS